MCPHQPPCPPADRPGRDAARTIARHPGQGWSPLCNGVIVFDDTGQLLPDGRAIPPHRPIHTPGPPPPETASPVTTMPRRRAAPMPWHAVPPQMAGRPGRLTS